ncbi:MAG: Gfo/Idh/MocA family oxidoreductase [Spirochaetaceae bacterium]|nr:Gfo/Idh/MocA family oxidoreductase [Spirochaetaceae bacterium]MCF7947168.1 Gfo/Idh/MocA family oxidoreductase [Spirochaetia bacterium]MCF7950033.1 Gfo/Idh/MocA family oxidoreductase [Spirochaetaceae bacterium]
MSGKVYRKRTKKVALVGVGRISNRHIEAIASEPGVEVTLVCDTYEDLARKKAGELGVPYITDYRQISKVAPEVDIAAVLTPSGNHPTHAAEIAETTDVPYILLEKPISLTLREAYDLFNRIDRAGKVLLPVFQNRYNLLVSYIKQLIDSGVLGTIYQFNCNVFWNRNNGYFRNSWHGTRELDGGVLYTQASHYVDMLHFFFGELVESKGLCSSLRGMDVHDTVSAVCRFAGGTVGSLNATVSVFRENYLTEFTLIAEKGTIRLSGTNLNTIANWDVAGIEKPDLDFSINHQYGLGHNTLYSYIAGEKWAKFPTRQEIISGIRMMEQLSY